MQDNLDKIFDEIESELRQKCTTREQYNRKLIKRYVDARFELIEKAINNK